MLSPPKVTYSLVENLVCLLSDLLGAYQTYVLSLTQLSPTSVGPHKIQGIGAGFVPRNLDSDVLNEVMEVSFQSYFFTNTSKT